MHRPSVLIENEAEEVSDTEVEELYEGMVEVSLSKETKARIRAPWSKALIVKVYGRIVGFNYLPFKINTLWNPRAKMDCMDLGRIIFRSSSLIRKIMTRCYEEDHVSLVSISWPSNLRNCISKHQRLVSPQ